MEQDVFKSFWNIVRAIKYSTITGQQIRNEHLDMCHHFTWELVEEIEEALEQLDSRLTKALGETINVYSCEK